MIAPSLPEGTREEVVPRWCARWRCEPSRLQLRGEVGVDVDVESSLAVAEAIHTTFGDRDQVAGREEFAGFLCGFKLVALSIVSARRMFAVASAANCPAVARRLRQRSCVSVRRALGRLGRDGVDGCGCRCSR